MSHPIDFQESSVDILENITRVFSRGMKYPSTEGKRVVDDTASNLLHGIGNVLEKQSKDALDKSTDSTKVRIRFFMGLVA